VTRLGIASFWLLLAGSAAAGTAAEAEQIMTGYRAEMKGWHESLRAAASVDEQREAWKKRPDGQAAAQRMWRCIEGELASPWTLKPAAWLLRMAAAFQGAGLARIQDPSAGAAPGADWSSVISAIRQAVETHHLQSGEPGLMAMCMALVEVPDPKSLSIIERVEDGHPDKKVQGIAALALSMMLKTLGDEGEVMRRRLAMLRKAIIESADVEIGGVTVAKIAEDELYVISHLCKGRVAPELAGRDVAGRPMKLSDYKGKVVVLLFWATWNGEMQQLLDLTGKLIKENADKPFALVGVNADATSTLKQLVADRVVSWPNFSDPNRKLADEYRIAAWPLAIVIDREGVIRYIGAPGSFVELTVDAILEEK
jgi:peroxiredoxin